MPMPKFALATAVIIALCAAAHAVDAPMHFTIGNDVALQVLPLKEAQRQMDAIAKGAAAARVTAWEPYVKWSMIEREPGKWDFAYYDMQVRTLQKHGLKWTPFLIAGPAYATPKWFKESGESVFAVCLEHGQPTRTQSIWNPNMPVHVDRLIEAFAKHFDHKRMQALLLGISGDFGETIFPVSGNDWTYTRCPDPDGTYHTHAGWWCGDEHATADFRRAMCEKYPTIDALNQAWKTKLATFDEAKPFLPDKSHSDRASLDMVTWYRGSMTRYAEVWLKSCKKHLPDVQVLLCTGGDANLMHGSDFSEQAIMAAKYGAGIRITNEASDYPTNFVITRWVGSSCRNLGTYFGYEPAGEVTEKAIAARIYNAIASGADELFAYEAPPAGSRGAVYARYRNLMVKRKPDVPVAIMLSKTSQVLGLWGQQYDNAKKFRDYSDYDFLDESLIAQGFLDRYKALIWSNGGVTDTATLTKIATWVQSGGIVLARVAPRDIDGKDFSAPLKITNKPGESVDAFLQRVATTIPDLLGTAKQTEFTRRTSSTAPRSSSRRLMARFCSAVKRLCKRATAAVCA